MADKAIVTTSWDDGHPLDLKLAELLSEYDIPASFYIPIYNTKEKCLNDQQIKEIAQGFDIGGHTYHHVHLPKVPPKKLKKKLWNAKKGWRR